MSDEAQQSKSKKDDWQTPPGVLDPIQKHDAIQTDPCAGEDTEIGYASNIRPPADGLSRPWPGTVFLNPPFSEKANWYAKAEQEYRTGMADRIYVISPASTDVQSWWHEYIAPNASVTYFPYGRTKYIDPETGEPADSPSFGSAVSVFGEAPRALIEEWEDSKGDLVYRDLDE